MMEVNIYKMQEILQRCQSCHRDARGAREMPAMPQRCQSCYRDARDAKESMEEIKENLIKMTNVIIKSRARSDPGKYDIVSYGI